MHQPDAKLVENCLRGDNKAFELLIRRYEKHIAALCMRMAGNADDAADAAQDAFIKAYHALATFRRESEFLPWLSRIAANATLDLVRSRTRRRAESLDDQQYVEPAAGPESSPERTALSTEQSEVVRGAVIELPPQQREAAALFYFAGLGIREISEALGQPQGTVKFNLHAARESLRKKLEGFVLIS